MKADTKDIGILGFGAMGSAIAERLPSVYTLWTFDKDKNKTQNLTGIQSAASPVDLVHTVGTLILAVKPQDFDTTLSEIKGTVIKKLIISIAAGIPTGYIEKFLGDVRVIRVMPNMPAKIGEGVSCLCKGKFAKDEDLLFSQELFDRLGKTLILNEKMMNAATAVSGSGPGYYFDIIERNRQAYEKEPQRLLNDFIASLSQAAEGIGFSRAQAKFLAENTAKGSQKYLTTTGISPDEAKKQIISKGGTTEAGLEALHRTGSLEEALKAAVARAEKLAKKE